MSTDAIINTVKTPFKRDAAVNSTNATFMDLVKPVRVKPAGARANESNFLLLEVLMVGADNVTGDVRVIGIHTASNGIYTEYILRAIAQYACIACAGVGAADLLVKDTERKCDAITQTFGPSSSLVISPTGDVPGHVMCDLEGCEFYLLEYKIGTATSMNALVGQI